MWIAAWLTLAKVSEEYGQEYRASPILPTDKSENVGNRYD